MSQTAASTTMSFHAHIKELRTRLFVVAAIFLVASAITYTFRDVVIAVLLAPLDGQQLSFLTLGGGFSFIFKIIIWSGIAIGLPFLTYSLYGFVAPALPERAQKKALLILLGSFFLLCCGALFGYFIAIPGAIHFLLTFAQDYVDPMLTADSYLNFILVYTVGLGVLFQIPLIMVIINWITPLGPRKLLAIERYVIVGAFIIAAIITPTPDAVNQTIIAVPVIAMYQIGFLGVLVSRRNQGSGVRVVRDTSLKSVIEEQEITTAKTTHTPKTHAAPAHIQPRSVAAPPRRSRTTTPLNVPSRSQPSRFTRRSTDDR